jgi:hypothetical protein
VEFITLVTNTLWFEIAVVTSIYALGQIFFAQFANHTAKWKRVLKIIIFTALACGVSAVLGRGWFFTLLGCLSLAVIVIHAWWLPKNGINGLTAEPKEKYYALRGWQLKD